MRRTTKRHDARLLHIGMRLVLRDKPKRLLTRIFGQQWRVPLLRYSAFGPLVSVLEGETVVLGGCYRYDTISRFSDVVGPKGRVVAIEANERNVDKLRSRIAADARLKNAGNIVLIAKGIWNEKGKKTFIANKGDDAALDKIESRELRDFSYHKVDHAERIEVEVDTLDNILNEAGVENVDFVLLTINDAELLALDGVDRLLLNNPNVRFLVHSQSPYPGQLVKKKLAAKGYTFRASPIAGSQLERIYAFRAGRSETSRPAVHEAAM